MNRDEFQRAEALFHRAMAVNPSRREEFLAEQCADDAATLQRVQGLLRGYAEDDFLMPPAKAALSAETCLPHGRRVGSYLLGRVIATGGMGAVYEASQERPRRTVALKVLRAGLASPDSIRRFEFESQVLARLRHPGIAAVYEAGVFDDVGGLVPFFAMELVQDAADVVRFAEARGLGRSERLALFLQVCAAVHHGHQQGVIHRDLKPANILVGKDGAVKVIDFGIARVTQVDGEAIHTLATTSAGFSGTLAYMAPEQCAAGSVDTRADVYSLGVVLYQLLCGRLPYDVSHSPLPEAADTIANQPPRRPSLVEPTVRGDIETIILKAIEKEPDRRYQSAAELARDIERCLAFQPIDARPPTMRYQLRMFARRHRALVAAAVAVAATLIAATAVSAWFAVAANQHAARAEAARGRAQRAAEFLRGALASANPMLPSRISAAMQSPDFEPFGDWRESPWPFAGKPGQQARVRDILAQAASQLEETFADDPLTHAMLADAMGWTLFRLDAYAEADPLLGRAAQLRRTHLGADHEETIRSLLHRAEFLQNHAGRHTEAEPLYVEALAACRRTFGAQDARTHAALRKAAFYYRGHLGLQAHSAELLRGPSGSGETIAQAETMAFRALLLSGGPEQPAAEALAVRAVERILTLAGPDSPQTANAMQWASNVAAQSSSLLPQAEEWQRRAIELHVKHLGEGGFWHAASISTLSGIRVRLGRLEEALASAREAQRLFRDMYGDEHFETIRAKASTAQTTALLDQTGTDGLRVLHEAGEEMASMFGRLESYGMQYFMQSAAGYWKRGYTQEALALMESVADRMQSAEGDTLAAHWYGDVYATWARWLAESGCEGESRGVLNRGMRAACAKGVHPSEYKELIEALAAAAAPR